MAAPATGRDSRTESAFSRWRDRSPSRGAGSKGVRRISSSASLAVAGFLGSVLLGLLMPRFLASHPTRDVVLLLLAVAIGGVAWRHSSVSIVAAVAAFVFSGLLRRVFPAADPSADAAAIFPFIVTLPLAARGVRFKKPASVTLLVVWAIVGATLSFSVPLVGLAGWLNFAVPLLAAFGIAGTAGGVSTFARAVVVCGAIAATYGVVQYFVAFPWDVAWLARAGVRSAGTFGEANFRPFATLPAPQTAAMLSAVVILVVVFRRALLRSGTILRGWALASCSVLLLLTLARTVWLALAVALVVGLLATGGRRAHQLVPFVAVIAVFVALAPQGQIVVGRAQTLTELETDKSYNARLDLVGRAEELFSPIGIGLGRLSAASRAGDSSTIDNGYLIVLGELGLVGAGLLIWVLIWLVRRSRRPDASFLTMLLVTSAGSFVFGNLPGLLLWTLSGIGHDEDDLDASDQGEPSPPSDDLRRAASGDASELGSPYHSSHGGASR